MNCTIRQDMRLADRLFRRWLEHPQDFPVTYTIDGRSFCGMPQNCVRTVRAADSVIELLTYTAAISCYTLRLEVTAYRDFVALEWTLYISNTGGETGPVLENLLAIDAAFSGRAPEVLLCNGDFCSEEGYETVCTPLPAGAVAEQTPVGGRACDQAFPYQRLLFEQYGINIAIGWPGQWHCRYEGTPDGVRVQAGQQTLHTVLQPGEALRSPRMTLVAFDGALERGVNVWRRWYLKHVLPHAHGQRVPGFVQAVDNGGKIEFAFSSEAQQASALQRYVDSGIDVDLWWIDAGWYPAKNEQGVIDWFSTSGTWRADPARYPNGLKPIGDLCERHGKDFVVWFEPERVTPGSETARQHPEWLLRRSENEEENGSLLLNLGKPECVQWIGKTIADFLRANNITMYRQDYNFEPLPYWRFNEADDRREW